MHVAVTPEAASQARTLLLRLLDNIRKTIKGKDRVIEDVIVCLLAGGHVLIEDAPGVGKTTLAYALAHSIDCSFSRLQFTSDLLPSDVTGVSVYEEDKAAFVFKPGPIFANIVLADEINRATPKTQSALLEVMDRARVSVDGQTHPVGSPFMVFGTQNPLDYEGTFPLPESQLDRFLMRLHMGYPSPEYELEILRSARLAYDGIEVSPVLSHQQLEGLQNQVDGVFVEASVLDYLLKIVTATRTDSSFLSGISVRGGLALKRAAQARALFDGREFVLPADIARLAATVFVHRLSPSRPIADALEERRFVASRVQQLVDQTPSPV